MTSERHIRTLLSNCAERAPDSVATQLPNGRRWTFTELDARSCALSAILPRGGRVGVRLGNDVGSIVAMHAVWKAGGTVVSAGRLVPDAEVTRRLRETSVAAVLDPVEDSADVRCTLLDGDSVLDHDDALIMFTSGTTGRPKAAVISARALEASVRGVAIGNGVPSEGIMPKTPARSPQPIFVPIAHMGGLLGSVTSWWLGKPVLLCPRFSVDLVAEIVQQDSVGVLRLTPAMVYELAHTTMDLALPGVKMVTAGTAALPEATQGAFEQRFAIPILRNYGQTEFAGAIAFERPRDIEAGRRPPRSVGRAAPGVEIKIVSADGHMQLPGDVGEVQARSASSMSGYLATEGDLHPDVAASEGWLATGDLGMLDSEGFLTLVGRVRDLIVCGGFNIYPAQLEAVLNRLPDVLDSAVVGLPDERLGEIPVAVVVSAEPRTVDAERIRALLRTDLAAYELPRQIRQVEAIPRFDSGKVDRSGVMALFVSSSAHGS